MKVAVLVTHGGEGLPEEVAASLREDPIDGLTSIIADELAVRNNVRFTDGINMAKAYPGSPNSKHYGYRRAAEVCTQCALEQFDLIVDLHATQVPNNDALYPTYHPTRRKNYLITSNRALGWGAFLLRQHDEDDLGWEKPPTVINAVLADNRSIGWSFREAITVEVSLDGPFANVPYLRQALGQVAAVGVTEKDSYPLPKLNFYKKVGSLRVDERDELLLPAECAAFTPLPSVTERHLERFGTRDIYAAAWGEHPDYLPYCGEVVVPHAGLEVRMGCRPDCCNYHRSLPKPPPSVRKIEQTDAALEGAL